MDIRFPQPGSDEPDKVTVTGLPDTVDNAIDHLLNLEEEYVSLQRCGRHTQFSSCVSAIAEERDHAPFFMMMMMCRRAHWVVFKRPSVLHLSQMLSVTETETLAAYMKPPSRYGGGGGAGGVDDSSGGPAKGFVVRDAPWNAAGNKVACTHL